MLESLAAHVRGLEAQVYGTDHKDEEDLIVDVNADEGSNLDLLRRQHKEIVWNIGKANRAILNARKSDAEAKQHSANLMILGEENDEAEQKALEEAAEVTDRVSEL